MSMSSAQSDELRTLANELRQIYEHNTDWLHGEAVTLASSVDAMREAADTIENLSKQVAKCQIASRHFELFSTPERTARTLNKLLPDSMHCEYCLFQDYCKDGYCLIGDYDALLEWLRGDEE